MGLDGWSRYATATITGSTDGDLTNYVIRVTVSYQSWMNSDFSDIRFCSPDGSTLLSHNRISYAASSSAAFDVKIPSIPANPSTYTLYVYSGNSAAMDVSDASIYIKYDNFDDSTLNTSLWTTNTPVGSVTESSVLNITIPSGINGDWYTSTKNSPIIYTPLPTENFSFSVKLGSYTVNQNTHAGIILYLDRNNAYFFGRYTGTSSPALNGLNLEKIVSNIYTFQIAKNTITSLPIWLKITKIGTTYTFSYATIANPLESDFTTFYTTSSAGFTPSHIGMFAKNWGNKYEIIAPFNGFNARPATSHPPTLSTLSSWISTSSIPISTVFPCIVSIVPYGGILIEDTNNIILSEMYYTVQRGTQSDIKEIVLVNQSSTARTVTLTPSASTSQEGSANETYNSQFLSADGITYTNSITLTVPAAGTKTIYTKYAPPDSSVPGAKEWKLATSQDYSLPFTMPTGWNYSAIIPITGSTDGDYSNIPVTVQIPFDGNVMKDNYGDIRFYSSGGTALNYELVSILGGPGTFKILIPSLLASPAVTKIFAIAGEEDATTTSQTVTGTTPTTAPTVGSIGAWQYYGGLQVKADVQYTKQEIEGLDYETSIGVWIGGVYYE